MRHGIDAGAVAHGRRFRVMSRGGPCIPCREHVHPDATARDRVERVSTHVMSMHAISAGVNASTRMRHLPG